MRGSRGIATALSLLMVLAGGVARAAAAPEGQMTWGVHISLAPTWFDPAETTGIVTPFMVMYALHDAMVKPMPGNPLAPSLAESWTVSRRWARVRVRPAPRRQVPQRRSGHRRGRQVLVRALPGRRAARRSRSGWRRSRVLDPTRVRFRLKEPWPDFLTFYSSATGAGWIVPKKYVEKVGDEGFKKHPIGAGPYRFVSFTPGVELVLEAVEQYWRKSPQVKRLVFKDDSRPVHAIRRAQAR